ncbi:MAG: Deoxyribodipyrimidine photolyase [uncultured Sphingomonadaceae bacterium]|uniref:Deoxyribodipyrimidine photolyase n=1 Tax=uncultured Sphingomonadaceae bacterium TaxID=169976 RepID=A0A6J4SA79_9SPHN|nr:MAG: Deoxyribodipyrimidine photolyase [uncultured Sphingomonadaceae bacterium]
MPAKTLIPILGDQLSLNLSSLRDADRDGSVLLMAEVADETTYVRHHRRKLAYILSAMRHHAEALCARGWAVEYVRLDDPDNSGSFTGEIARACARHDVERIVVTEAGEWRVQGMLEAWETLFGVSVEIRSDTRFIASHAEFEEWAEGRGDLVMEYFYREQRVKTGLLMDGSRPEGGRWNYDKENRKPAEADLFMPQPPKYPADAITRGVIAMVEARFPGLIGSLDDWDLAVTREDALHSQAAFLDTALCGFGDYQDAMVTGAHRMWHGHLSPYINSGLLDPLALCREVDRRYQEGRAPLNCAEGYVRQIIGWREYMRGVYWLAGPDYIDRNFFGNTRRLPRFYWTADTEMNCLHQALGQTWRYAYAHHIQRLMVTGNFALLIGADPKAVHDWYMEVYLDAYEWVTLPNTLGMSQYGDGGLIGTKPYAASGAYINRMSDYCGRCVYDPTERVGEDACPFNALYWDFLDRNRDRLGGNARLRNQYRTWDRFGDGTKAETRAQAAGFLARLDAEPTGYGGPDDGRPDLDGATGGDA